MTPSPPPLPVMWISRSPLRERVQNPFRGEMGPFRQHPACMNFWWSSFHLKSCGICPLCSERALQRDEVHPTCLFFDPLSEPSCRPGGFPNFEAASTRLIIVTRHLKFCSKFIGRLSHMRGIERLAELGGDNFLRALTPGTPLAAPPQKWRGRMAPLLLAWNSQWPLVGMDVPCPQKIRPLVVIKQDHHLRNKDKRKTLDFSLQIMTSFLLVWHGAAIKFAHLRWAYCCMCRTDFLSQICNPKGLADCYVF